MSNIFIFLLVFLYMCFGCNCKDVFLMYIRLCLICVHVSCISTQPIGRILDWSSKLAWYANMGTPIENHLGADEILNQFGDINTLALENIIEPSDGMDEKMTFMIPSQYYTIDSLPVKMSHSSNFNVISLNAQSINAKFDSLLTFLEVTRQQNNFIHVICIQESWLDEKSDLSLYQIEGYTCISQGKRCSSHGGLITYVDSQFNTSIMNIENDSP